MDIHALSTDLARIRERSPLIHNLTNYVVMNNTANALLSIGASPVMAHALPEVEEMARIASAVVLNIGTLEPSWVEAMLLAGKAALEKRTPVIFDPVGAGATSYRNEVSHMITKMCKPVIIRGNASEILALGRQQTHTKGVDSTDASSAAIEAAGSLSKSTGAVVVVSGQTDYITYQDTVLSVPYGDPMMTRVTGMGCTATAIVATFAAVNPDPLKAAFHGMAVMGIAGEIAARSACGNGSLQVGFLDTLYRLDHSTIYSHLNSGK